MRKSIAILGIVISVSACVRTDYGYVNYRCARPPAKVLGNPEQAILAAREIWYCINPRLARTDEQHWLQNYRAWSKGGVWHVAVILPDGYAGGGLNMELGQGDGRLLDVYLTQ
ncbi:MAG: hypothetical protein IT480_19225 [Gammaproteobacteria bacterium]|nr:hypothetical protein [Gammaproteobacteria bacterium]